MQKRQNEVESDNNAKRARYESSAIVALSHNEPKTDRTSDLSSPTIQLSGHDGAVYSVCFDPSGTHLASASFDKQIFLWDVFNENKNYAVLSGHKSAVLEVKWCKISPQIISCSADTSVVVWDANRGSINRRLSEHKGIVNSCTVASNSTYLLASGSDDNSCIVWDSRSKKRIAQLTHPYQVTAVAMNSSGDSVFSGGIDNIIRHWDVRKLSSPVVTFELKDHFDTITGLAVSPDDKYLLSNAMDNAVLRWDVQPFFVPTGQTNSRRVQEYSGGHHGAEKALLRCCWSSNQELVSAGSADRLVHVWDSDAGTRVFSLPGHKGSVNEVNFHPTQRIIASCSTDKTILLGEY